MVRWYLRDEIAANNGISAGMISTIINETRGLYRDFDLMREVALNLRKTGLDLNTFAFTVRLQNKLYRLGISEDLLNRLSRNYTSIVLLKILKFQNFYLD